MACDTKSKESPSILKSKKPQLYIDVGTVPQASNTQATTNAESTNAIVGGTTEETALILAGLSKGSTENLQINVSDYPGYTRSFRTESNRMKSLVTKNITIDELRIHFDRPIIEVAKDFGICITLMKKICRRNGIKRWPHRQIRSLSKSIASMEAAMLSVRGPEREKYKEQIRTLKRKRDLVIADPNKDSDATDVVSGELNTRPPKTPSPLYKDFRAQQHVSPHAKSTTSVASSSKAPAINTNSIKAKGEDNGLKKTSSSNTAKGGRWTAEEHASFLEGIRLYGKDWRRVAKVVKTRSAVQTRTHAQKYLLKFAGRFPFDPTTYSPSSTANSTQNRSTSSLVHNNIDTEMESKIEDLKESPVVHNDVRIAAELLALAPITSASIDSDVSMEAPQDELMTIENTMEDTDGLDTNANPDKNVQQITVLTDQATQPLLVESKE